MTSGNPSRQLFKDPDGELVRPGFETASIKENCLIKNQLRNVNKIVVIVIIIIIFCADVTQNFLFVQQRDKC